VTLEAREIDGVRCEIHYTYDDAGNRTSMTYPDGTTVRFEYNERNQLVRIPGFFEGPAAGVWTDNAGFRYDANGFLIGMRAVNGIETAFQPDERNRLKQISSSPPDLDLCLRSRRERGQHHGCEQRRTVHAYLRL